MKSHTREKITPHKVASFFRRAFCNIASAGKGKSGFRAMGIFPIDPSVYKDEDFLAANTLNDPVEVAVGHP